MRSIVLIRHVETDMAGKFCGHSDPDASPAGMRQIEEILHKVESLGIEHLFSSDLRRAAQTAQAVGRPLGVPIELRPGLREIHFGEWEGMSWQEVATAFPHDAELWIKEYPLRSPNGGEGYDVFNARVRAEITSIVSALPFSNLAIVTHRGVMQSAMTRIFGLFEPDARAMTERYGSVIVLKDVDLRTQQL